MAFIRKINLNLSPAPVNGVIAPGGIDVSALRCTFTVKKTTKPKPNHAVIKVYNLNSDNQAFLTKPSALSVLLEAGYEDEGMQQIYLGEVRSAETKQDGPNYVTTMSTDDKGRKLQNTQIHVPIGAGASLESVVRTILGAMNSDPLTGKYPPIGEGNLASTMKQLRLLGITSLHPRGGTLSGFAAKELTDLCNSVGLSWSVTDGALYMTLNGTYTSNRSLVLSSDTGLIGSPVVDNEGRVTAEMIMIPGIRLGAVVDFDAKFISGGYKIHEVTYQGDTHGQDWHCKFLATKY